MTDMWQEEARKKMVSFDGILNDTPRESLYTTHHVKFPSISQKYDVVTQPVCQFLIGLPFDDAALAFLSAFGPEKILVTTGRHTLVGYFGKKAMVTVDEKNIIKNVSLSAPISLPKSESIQCSNDLTAHLEKTRKQFGLKEILRSEWF